MATEQEIAHVLHLKTIMPDIVFTGKNKKIYEEFLAKQEEDSKEFQKSIKKIKQIREPIGQEVEPEDVKVNSETGK